VPGVPADLLDHADAGGHPDRPAGELDRRGQRVQQPAGGPQPGAGGDRLDQHRELVAAEPGDHVVRADGGGQPLGQPDQQPVAGGHSAAAASSPKPRTQNRSSPPPVAYRSRSSRPTNASRPAASSASPALTSSTGTSQRPPARAATSTVTASVITAAIE